MDGDLTHENGAPHGDMDRLTLRFVDPDFEAAFRRHHFENNLTNVRAAHLLGLALWLVWGVFVSRFLTQDRVIDLTVRYGVMIPLVIAGLWLTFTRVYPRVWETEVAATLLVTALGWVTYAALIESMPADYGYVGLILILTFGFAVLRMRFLIVALFAPIAIAYYVAVALSTGQLTGLQLSLASFYLFTFWVIGMVAAYTLERNTRLLFLRERQLEREHRRSDNLLLNILPQAIVDRLKAHQEDPRGGRLAESFSDVTVLFVDTAGFTREAEKTAPDQLVDALDRLFTGFDALADRFGLEKIKTVGDAYMAVAGAPHRRPDHAEAAAEMALAILDTVAGSRWPSGNAIRVRIGLASGPVVAGVIGQRKFAYDLWGDTVNLASRLESHGEPGRIVVSEGMAERLGDRYRFGHRRLLDLKGKGPTPVRFLTGRRSSGGEEARASRAAGVPSLAEQA